LEKVIDIIILIVFDKLLRVCGTNWKKWVGMIRNSCGHIGRWLLAMRAEERKWKMPFQPSPEQTEKVIQYLTQINWYQSEFESGTCKIQSRILIIWPPYWHFCFPDISAPPYSAHTYVLVPLNILTWITLCVYSYYFIAKQCRVNVKCYWIWGSHSNDCKEFCLLGYNAL
jgi:hypothetical protein